MAGVDIITVRKGLMDAHDRKDIKLWKKKGFEDLAQWAQQWFFTIGAQVDQSEGEEKGKRKKIKENEFGQRWRTS